MKDKKDKSFWCADESEIEPRCKVQCEVCQRVDEL